MTTNGHGQDHYHCRFFEDPDGLVYICLVDLAEMALGVAISLRERGDHDAADAVALFVSAVLGPT